MDKDTVTVADIKTMYKRIELIENDIESLYGTDTELQAELADIRNELKRVRQTTIQEETDG